MKKTNASLASAGFSPRVVVVVVHSFSSSGGGASSDDDDDEDEETAGTIRSSTSVSSSLDALERLFGRTDADPNNDEEEGNGEKEEKASTSSRPNDPFADDVEPLRGRMPTVERSSRSGIKGNGNGSFGGKRSDASRTELEDLLDVGMRFEGLRTLVRAASGGFGTDLGDVEVGQLVVVGLDAPSLQLWYGQAYEVRRAYFQRRDDELGTRRIDAGRLGEPPPSPADPGEKVEWELWVELFSEEYHASPVRVRPDDVGLRTVGTEVGEALQIAVPIACFWVCVSASFVLASMSDPTNLTFKG